MNRRYRVIQGGSATRRESRERAASDRPNFEEVVVSHLDSLFALALRLVRGRRERAEDLVQEACLRAFKNFHTVRAPEKIKPWLFQILLRTFINEFHRQNRQPSVVDLELSDALLESASIEPAPTPEEELLAHLLDGEVQRALDALPIEFRTVVWLADVEELSYKEIADIVGCPPGTVASRLYRGHSLLRERLWEYGRRRGFIETESAHRSGGERAEERR